MIWTLPPSDCRTEARRPLHETESSEPADRAPQVLDRIEGLLVSPPERLQDGSAILVLATRDGAVRAHIDAERIAFERFRPNGLLPSLDASLAHAAREGVSPAITLTLTGLWRGADAIAPFQVASFTYPCAETGARFGGGWLFPGTALAADGDPEPGTGDARTGVAPRAA